MATKSRWPNGKYMQSVSIAMSLEDREWLDWYRHKMMKDSDEVISMAEVVRFILKQHRRRLEDRTRKENKDVTACD